MQTISVRQANQHFSHYLALVDQGQEFVIAKRGREVARLIPVRAQAAHAWADGSYEQRFEQARSSLDQQLSEFRAVKFGGPYKRDDCYD